jgi:phosphoserine aminotransferase
LTLSKLYTGCAGARLPLHQDVTFTLPSEEQTADFIKQAKSKGIINIKGHRAPGGNPRQHL